jgi:hypothetical protein
MKNSPFVKIAIPRYNLYIKIKNYSLTYLSTHSFALKSYILTKFLAVFKTKERGWRNGSP